MVKCAQYSISPKVNQLNNSKVNEKIDWIKDKIPEGESDLVIAIGGDGEVLKSFHDYPNKTLIGFKIEDGHSLGFYSAIDLLEVDEIIIDNIKNEQYKTLNLPLLKYRINNEESYLLNELCIQRRLVGKSGKFIVDVGEDNLYAMGDGVIICTPSGSSGYNFSSGGSIISWDLHAYSIRFFNLTGGLRSISIVVKGEVLTKIESLYECVMESDGRGEELPPNSHIEVKLSDKYCKLAYFEYHGQLSRLKRMIKSSKIE